MSNEQITQETVPVDQATTETQPQATQANPNLSLIHISEPTRPY